MNVLVRTGRGGVNQHGQFTDGVRIVKREPIVKKGVTLVVYKCRHYTVKGDDKVGRYICLNEERA